MRKIKCTSSNQRSILNNYHYLFCSQYWHVCTFIPEVRKLQTFSFMFIHSPFLIISNVFAAVNEKNNNVYIHYLSSNLSSSCHLNQHIFYHGCLFRFHQRNTVYCIKKDNIDKYWIVLRTKLTNWDCMCPIILFLKKICDVKKITIKLFYSIYSV